MCHIATNWARKQPLKPSPKAVLLALADHMNGKTGKCFPGISTIARDAGVSERSVNSHLKALCEGGFIKITRNRRAASSYELNLRRGEQADLFETQDLPIKNGSCHAENDVLETQNLRRSFRNPGILTPDLAIARSGERARETKPDSSKEKSGKQARPGQAAPAGGHNRRPKATPIPEGFVPSIADAVAIGLDAVRARREAGKFRDYMLAHATLMADWPARWRTWCWDTVERYAPRAQRPPKQSLHAYLMSDLRGDLQ